MSEDPNAPKGKGEAPATDPAWKEAGFGSEAEAIEAAKSVSTLRGEIEAKEAELEKERTAKNKTNTDYMRQSKEIGDLRKKLKDAEDKVKGMDGSANHQSTPPTNEEDDATLDSLSDEDAEKLDKVLNAPEHVELKKQVIAGSKKAMAEFIRAYRDNAPPDISASVFASWRKQKVDQVPASSIARTVKALFHKENEQDKNSLAAVPPGGAPADKDGRTKKPTVFGGVTADFFRKNQT